MTRLLAIDSGLTVTKAVIFDGFGQQLGVAQCNVRQLMPKPHHVERDMDDLWRQTATAIREVLEATKTNPNDIAAIGVTAHGDGLYLLDKQAKPLGHGILSLDSRAAQIVRDWQRDGTDHKSLAITGQMPHVSAPSSLLAWIKQNDPDKFAKIGHIIGCKDWLRFCLTHTLGTDRTEASTSFTDVNTQTYSKDALALFGLSELAPALVDVAHSADVVGAVTDTASHITGLRPGTPVVAGVHDVTASALGIGAHAQGIVGIVAGTYSINECLSDAPKTNAAWFCRNGVDQDTWNSMAISPASTTNYDWFIDTFCAAERDREAALGNTIHTLLAPEIEAGLSRASSILYHPYLFGSPFGAAPSAGLNGLRGWHDRGDILAALLEGIAFNHRQHIDDLRDAFPAQTARLTGGVSRNPAIAQLFADVLAMPVVITDTDEAAAWGAALCAGAGVGLFGRFDADPRDLADVAVTYRPRVDHVAHYAARFAAYRNIATSMPDMWSQLNALGGLGPRGSHD
jgi:L-xylulokinase